MEQAVDKAPEVKDSAQSVKKVNVLEELRHDDMLTSQEIEQLEDVLEQIAEEKRMHIERSTLAAIKEDISEYKEVSNLTKGRRLS